HIVGAGQYDRKYKIIVLIELGDRREGILVDDLDGFIPQVTSLKNIALSGIGVNLTCLNGIRPTAEKMNELSQIAGHLRKHFSLELGIVSGGNSANNQWLKEINDPGLVNHLRMGEAILLGTDPLTQAPMDGLQTGAFLLSAEVIESRRKPSLPDGIPTFTAFGDIPEFVDEGDMNRAIVAIGLQDVDPLGCAPVDPDFRIIGTTSDHMVIDSGDRKLSVGDVVQFNLTYRAMLPLMISPYVQKVFI
ncbi:MAG: alanine/ornithine racemase family PLP-dependent enzyme, partial [Chloroflexi bacterium]|nr:alanine/ornithine racemase family PLP-dependent enzyme [Chloroflexota bacterium]